MLDFQRLRVDEIGDVTVAHICERCCTGGLEIEELGRELYQLVEGGQRRKLLLDFSSVDLVSSAAIGKLISLNRRTRAANGVLRLCNVPDNVLHVFHTCRLHQVLDIHTDESDALMAFSE
jgi:anti-sigma B factor antagonist